MYHPCLEREREREEFSGGLDTLILGWESWSKLKSLEDFQDRDVYQYTNLEVVNLKALPVSSQVSWVETTKSLPNDLHSPSIWGFLLS